MRFVFVILSLASLIYTSPLVKIYPGIIYGAPCYLMHFYNSAAAAQPVPYKSATNGQDG
jgi:hypothetical protein